MTVFSPGQATGSVGDRVSGSVSPSVSPPGQATGSVGDRVSGSVSPRCLRPAKPRAPSADRVSGSVSPSVSPPGQATGSVGDRVSGSVSPSVSPPGHALGRAGDGASGPTPPSTSAANALGAVTPSRAEFRELAAVHRVIPVTRRLLADDETPVGVYRKLAGDRAGTFLLESAENGRSWSRWSFVGAHCAAALTAVDGGLVWTGEVPDKLPTVRRPPRGAAQTCSRG